MEPPRARPKAPKPPPSAPASARRSRKRVDAVRDLPSIMVRLDPDIIARLDVVVARKELELRAQGGHTSRGAIAGVALREYIEREEAAVAAQVSP